MSANRREAITLLRFQQVKREVSDAERTLKILRTGYAELQDMVRDTDRVLAAGSSRLAQIARQNRSVVAPSYNELRASIEGAAEAQEQFNRQQQGGRGGGRGLNNIGFGATRLAGLAGGAGIPGAAQGLRLVDDIADSIEAVGVVGAPVVAILGSVAVGFAALEFSLRDAKKALDDATKANQFFYQELGRLTSDQASQQLADAQAQLERDRAELANIQQAFGSGFAGAAEEFGDAGARVLTALGQVSSADDALTARADELSAAIAENETRVNQLTGAMQDGTLAANDAAAAELALAALRQANTDRQIQNEIRVLSNISQSSEALDSRIEAINREQEVLQDYLAAGNLSAALTEQLTNRMIDLSSEESLLAIRIRPIIEAREEEAAALAFQQQQLEEVSAAIKSYNADVQRIEQKALEDRANAQDRFNKALVSAAEAAADAAENALQKLLDKRAELAQDFTRDEIDAEKEQRQGALDRQIEAQRDEARALRDHAREMADIRRQAERDEQDLIANRDFAGLFRLRRDTGHRLEDAARAFNDERAERIESYRQAQQDAVDQYTREREQRQAKYLQDLADAQVQYQRELVQVEVNRRKALQKAQQAYSEELRLLGEKLRADLNARRQAYDIEIQMAAQTSAVRQQILMKELQFAQMVLASIGKGGASGSSASGMSVPGGNNTSIRGGTSFNQTNNISGAANPDALARLIDQRARRMLEIELGAA